MLTQPLADLSQRLALPIAEVPAPLDLVTDKLVPRYQVLVPQQQFLINGPCNGREQYFSTHTLLRLGLFLPHAR
jgi:hypothetical protein